MNLISLSLFGSVAKYQHGARRWIDIVLRLPRHWQLVIFADENFRESLQFSELSGRVQIFFQGETWHENGMFWRYYAVNLPAWQRIIFRDADSVPSDREWQAVAEWEHSSKLLHVIRDHPQHGTEILGGLFGLRNDPKIHTLRWNQMWSFGKDYGDDQKFLREHVYYPLKEEVFSHDNFFCFESVRASLPYDGSFSFMGESLDEFGFPDEDARQQLQTFLKRPAKRFLLKVRTSLRQKIPEAATKLISKGPIQIP